MAHEELVYLTLKQLSENLKNSPEGFRLEDPSVIPSHGNFPGPTIVWQYKYKPKDGDPVEDPHHVSKTVIVTYNRMLNQISCHIYFREVNTMTSAMMADSQAAHKVCQFPILSRTYRKFMKIHEKLVKQYHEKEFIQYMKKLNDVFPSIHEEELFK